MIVRVPVRGVDLRPDAPGMVAAHVIEIGAERQRLRVLAAGDLRAAHRERIEDPHGRHLDRGGARAVAPRVAHAGPQERAAAERADLLHHELAVVVLARVGALLAIPLADALVPVLEGVVAKAEAQRLIDGQRVIDIQVAVEAVVVALDRHRFGAVLAIRRHDVDVRRLAAVHVVDEEVERALVLDQRAAAAHAEIAIAFRPAFRHERAAAAQRIAEQAIVHVHPHRPHARLRDDLDVDAARGVEFRGELIARDADRSDLRLVRQRRAFEAVDADHRAGAGHVHQLLAQHLGIVGQIRELLARQRRAERRSARIGGGGLLVLADQHGFLVAFDRQHQHLLVVAVSDADVGQHARFESGEFRLAPNTVRARASESSRRLDRSPSPARSPPPCSQPRCR